MCVCVHGCVCAAGRCWVGRDSQDLHWQLCGWLSAQRVTSNSSSGSVRRESPRTSPGAGPPEVVSWVRLWSLGRGSELLGQEEGRVAAERLKESCSVAAIGLGSWGRAPFRAEQGGPGWGLALVAQWVKNLPAVWKTRVQSLGLEDPLVKGTATHSSILAWRVSWTEEPSRLQSVGLQRVRYN